MEKRRVIEALLESSIAKGSDGMSKSPRRKKRKSKGYESKSLSRQGSMKLITTDPASPRDRSVRKTQKLSARQKNRDTKSSSRKSSPTSRTLKSPKRKRTMARLSHNKGASSPDFIENAPHPGSRVLRNDSNLLAEYKSQVASLQSTVESQTETICVLHRQNDNMTKELDEKEKWLHERDLFSQQIENLSKQVEKDVKDMQHMKGHLRSVENRLALREKCLHEKDMSILLLQEEICEEQRKFSDSQLSMHLAQQIIEEQITELTKLRHIVNIYEEKRASKRHSGSQYEVQTNVKCTQMDEKTCVEATQTDEGYQQNQNIQVLQDELSCAQHIIDSLNNKLEHAQKECNAYKEQRDTMQTQLSNQIDSHTEAISDLTREHMIRENGLQENLACLNERISALKQQEKKLYSACGQYKDQTQKLRNQVEESKRSLTILQTSHSQDLVTVAQYLAQLQQQNEREVFREKEKSSELAETLGEKLRSLTLEREKDKREILKLEQELKATEDVLHTNSSDLQREKTEKHHYQKQVDELHRKLVEVQDSTTTAISCAQCNTTDDHLNNLERKVEEMRHEEERLRTHVESFQEEKDELLEKLQTQLDTGRRLMELNTSLKEVKIRAEKALEEKTTEYDSMIVQVSSKCSTLEADNSKLKSLVQSIGREKKSLQVALEKQQHALSVKTSQMDSQMECYVKLLTEHRQLERMHAEAVDALGSTREKMVSLESESLQLSKQLQQQQEEATQTISALRQKEKENSARNAFRIRCLLTERKALKQHINTMGVGQRLQKRVGSASSSSTTQQRPGVHSTLFSPHIKPARLILDSHTIVSQLKEDHEEVVVQSPIRSPLCISSCRTISTESSFRRMQDRDGFPLVEYIHTLKFAVRFLLLCGVVPNRLILFVLLRLALLA
eukprot:CAMPEP_0117442332 /NCGR_PEP_ID=MMETSP0759-20121206/4095_1 /TAXON_ID=63605 /ORGANISM="Percolomonas cosmopolitus, Strain WS" /LENGTH=903 /DNA_ID=CAMNT_0005234213 /DNA_START=225 /DNA_END=2936 /DNA_ORIENTATION=-